VDLLSERFLPAGLGDDRQTPGSVALSGTAVEKGILGGIGTMGSYGLALWAMTQAPLAVVAALRETSILFGALLAWLLLKRRLPEYVLSRLQVCRRRSFTTLIMITL
jgi:hypothetical protein